MCSWLPNIRDRLPRPSPWTKKTRHCEPSEAVFLYPATSVICGFADSRICLVGLRAKDGSINRAKDVSPLRVGTLRSLLRSYKTRIRNNFQSMFRQAQHDRKY